MTSATPLKARVLHMARWTLFGFGAAQGLRLASNLVLTRLLSPEAFGVMAVGLAVVVALVMLSDLGLEAALVQRQGQMSANFVNTAWSMQILRGVGIGLGLLCFSGIVLICQKFQLLSPNSTFYSPKLPVVLAILALAPVISGFDSTAIILAGRNLAVARLIKVQFLDALFASIITVSVAWIFNTVYSMAIGWVCGASLRVALSHLVLGGQRHQWCWDEASRKDIQRMGKWIFISTAMTFFINGGDRLILGYFLNSTEMGLYSIAFMLASTGQTLLHKFNSVGLPLFSEVARERPNELATIFHKIRLPVDLISLTMAGLLAGLAPLVIHTMYDSRYAGAAPMFAALAFLIAATRYDLLSGCWVAMAQPRRLTVLSSVRMGALLIFLPAGFYLGGATGAAWGVSAAALTNHPVGWWYMRQSGLLQWRRELLPLPALPVAFSVGWLLSHRLLS